MENIYDTTPHDWVEEDNKSWQRWVDHMATNYPTFAETVNSIKNPLYEKDVFDCFEEDTYKGIIAALLWLNVHRRRWLEFYRFPSQKADRIRHCVNYVANLLEEQRLEMAFYSQKPLIYPKRWPEDVETCYIMASRPWEMLHFIGYKLPPEKRLPVFHAKKHFSMLKEADPRLAFHWYTEWKDGRLEADMGEIYSIYLDYCERVKTNNDKCTYD